MSKSNLFLAVCVIAYIILLLAMPVHAQEVPSINDVTSTAPLTTPVLVYLGTDVLDQNGTPVVNNTYTVDCGGDNDLTISIEVTFTDGGVSLRTGEYCDVKIYIEGTIVLAQIVAVSSPPDAVYRVWLPVLSR